MDEKSREIKEKSGTPDKSIDERVHQQLVYKDNRIIDLNNVILDKERQILDLQERVREHNEVATVKNQAMRIVQQKFEELHRDKKDMSTETEPSLLNASSQKASSSSERRARSSSPGHVIAARKTMTPSASTGTFSPPPLDPPFESTSTSSKLSILPDIDAIHRKHHQRKRVTFDLNPNAPVSILTSSRHSQMTSTSSGSYQNAPESLEHALTEAASENALLRLQVSDLNSAVEKMKQDYEAEIVKYTKEAKTAGLKAKVAATARIKELESSLEKLSGNYTNETDRLQEEVDTLRSSRNWEIEQNGHLRDQVAHLKEKTFKLTEELDASEKAKRALESEVNESKKLMELMVEDLLQAENVINYHVNQKTAIFEDIDRLKEAITAQDRFIEILEADIVIYEQHIGLLRENLGASQIDHRALIKSKAFETKLHALEREKEQSVKKSNEDRLKTKALDKKCRVLVEQNEQLMARLCELEMSSSGGAQESESKTRRLTEQEERIRQISSALESEREASQRLREAKEALEKELSARRKQEESQHQRVQMDVEMSMMEAQNKVDEMSVERDAARKKAADVQAEVEQLRATNFDLQMHIETAKRTLEELADSNEQLEKQIEKIDEDNEERDEDLKQAVWDVETLTRQNEALSSRVELDGARQAFHETTALKEEVKILKQDLTKQQDARRAEFEESCRRLQDSEDVPERKTSLEVQQEQYILAYEERIAQMAQEMEQLRKDLELKAGPVQRKTTAALEPPSIQQIQMVQNAPPDWRQVLNPAYASEAPSNPEVPVVSPELVQAHEELKKEIEILRQNNKDFAEKMERLELEAHLSGELNVELGRAMIELEEHNELLMKQHNTTSADQDAKGRELDLQSMLVQEMTEQIESMQDRIDEMAEQKKAHAKEVDELRAEATTAQAEVHRVNTELQRMLHNLAESEIARKDEFESSTAAYDAEIREFSIRMEDARREISDLEVKLQEKEEQLAVAQATIAQAEVEKVQKQETQILTAATPASAPEASESTEDHQTLLHTVSTDMNKLIELKDELEIAVQALKAEIWSLNGQLKASILDREALEDKVTLLDDMVEKEKKRAIALDVELQEQVDLTDRAVRRAAEAENESNQRMAECLEKESSREEIEKAYTRLSEYYKQLQEAYNQIYAELAQAKASEDGTTSSTHLTSSETSPPEDPRMSQIVDGILTILLISRDPAVFLTTQQKMERIADKLKQLLEEYDENHKALEEQRRITEALEQRLQTLEAASGSPDVATTTRQRVEELEGEIEWKEEECEALRRRIQDLEKALEAVAERADEGEAARLTTRQADVDSLFRTNAELAHTNVRLQNEVDEADELRAKMVEEKEQLEQHVKELEEQVAELMEQHETHLQQTALLQSTTPILKSSVSSNPETETQAKLEESEKEIQRLTGIEKTLNTRILALEDQNLELEEKVQDIEDEMMTVKNQMAKDSESTSKTPKDSEDAWDDWGEEKKQEEDSGELQEAKEEVERLLDVEKALTMRVEMLQAHNEQLEKRVKEVGASSQKDEEEPKKKQQDDDWGWGDDDNDEKNVEIQIPSAEPSVDPSELAHAKTEVTRLTQIEKVLNNRILALEDQNLELEERLQELEDELADEKKKGTEPKFTEQTTAEEDNWGDWDEEKKDSDHVVTASEAEESKKEKEQLRKTIEDLQERVNFQKEVIQKAETELIEIQDKYDELDEAYQKSQESQFPNETLIAELKALRAQLDQAQQEKQEMKVELETIEAEKKTLEERIQSLEAELQDQKTPKDDDWGDEGWGVEEKKGEDSDEILKLRQDHDQLLARIQNLELENSRIQEETSRKIEAITTEKSKIEEELDEALAELDELRQELQKKEIQLKENVVQKTSEVQGTSSAWDDDWNDADDGGEIEKMREAQTVMEMKVEALREELQRVKESEQELSEKNQRLQADLKTIQNELELTQKRLEEAESQGWNDDDAWNQKEDSEDVRKELEAEISRRDVTIEELQKALKQASEASETSESSTKEILAKVQAELKAMTDQNELLKDSEARLMDHADEYAEQMEVHRNKCVELQVKVTELEEQLRVEKETKKAAGRMQEEFSGLRQQLSTAQSELHATQSQLSDREGVIAELTRKLAEQTRTIEELQAKLKTLVARRPAPSTQRASMSSSAAAPTLSRPSSRLSTSSRISTTSSFVPDAHSVPLQSTGSAFDVVVPQSGEPLRRRNK